jgi:hypothetical protein
MKKILCAVALLLTLVLALVYRQLVSYHGKHYTQKVVFPAAIQESLVLSSLLIQ